MKATLEIKNAKAKLPDDCKKLICIYDLANDHWRQRGNEAIFYLHSQRVYEIEYEPFSPLEQFLKLQLDNNAITLN